MLVCVTSAQAVQQNMKSTLPAACLWNIFEGGSSSAPTLFASVNVSDLVNVGIQQPNL
jgi:hypothetical protein